MRPLSLAQQRASDLVDLQPVVTGTAWMASNFLTRVWSPASGLCHAARFDSSVGASMLYLFSAALEVGGRVSNPRPIALARCILCPEHSLHATWRPLLLHTLIPMLTS